MAPWKVTDGYGRSWQNYLENRSTKHFEYLHKKRVNGSLYDYDYGVYYESGAFVSASRKRRGFFRKINGWKDINAEELEITCKNMVFKLKYNMPTPPKFPQEIMFVGNNNWVTTNMSDRPLKTLDFYGPEFKYKEIAKAAKMGLKELAKISNKKVDPNTKVVRYATPNVLYTEILECRVSQKNIKQVRKVFNSGVKFFISLNILKKPLSFGTVQDMYKGLKNIPVQHIEEGRVILTSKIDGKWGGIVIDKDHKGEKTENIIK